MRVAVVGRISVRKGLELVVELSRKSAISPGWFTSRSSGGAVAMVRLQLSPR